MKSEATDLVVKICGTDEVIAAPDLDLFEAGLLDSMTFVELLVGLENIVGEAIPPTEVERDELATLNRVLEFVAEYE